MSKKKPTLNDKQNQELEGFEDVLDLVGLDKSAFKKSARISDSQIEDYEIYDFLEKENLRLEKIDRFFNTQIPIDKEYDQTKRLIKREIGEVKEIKDELALKLMEPNSDFLNFLGKLYDKAFN